MIAIIIPYYKLTFFRETLESLAAQTDQKFNVYIGNDASPEDPNELLKEFEGKFNYTYKKFGENLGGICLTKQWERCLEMVQSEEWFMILGDDDILGERVVELFYSQLDTISSSSHVVRFATQLIDEDSNRISKVWYQPKLEHAIDSYYRKFKGENRGSLSEFIFRKIKYEKYKFKKFDLGWSADEFAVLDFSDGKPIFSINDENVYFRISKLNITGQKDNSDRKHKALISSTKLLLIEYSNIMSKEMKSFVVRFYDNLIFSSKEFTTSQFVYLQYLTIRYVGLKLFISQWKAVVHRIIK